MHGKNNTSGDLVDALRTPPQPPSKPAPKDTVVTPDGKIVQLGIQKK